MVHPEYRRKGVFKKLFSLVQDEWYKRDAPKMLLLSDRKSEAGQAFVKRTHAEFEHAEHEMYLKGSAMARNISGRVSLRKATNEDSREVGMQNAVYFGTEYNEAHVIKPEEEAKRGLMIYLAEAENTVIGKIHLEHIGQTAGIYGFGVKPEFRRKGYGREILSLAVEKLKEGNPERIILQVEVMNDNALNLYKSCGFEAVSTMDYYELSK
jgi:ribosomal protein S18 acetylase RimI-like enzyme